MRKFISVTKTFFTVAFVALTLNISAQKKEISKVEVKKTTEVINPTAQSITYTLPQTVVNIKIETEKIIKKEGPYYRYSQRFLNLTNVISEDSEEWIIKGVKISTTGKPNNSQRYSIYSKGNTSAHLIHLTQDGILLGMNNNPLNNTLTKTPDTKTRLLSLEDIYFDNISLPEELLYKTSTAAMAQEAANMIYKIRSNRIKLLSGELENLPPDGEAYKTVLNELDKMEKDFISLFAGKTVSVKSTQTFTILPDPLSSYTNHVLCRFSAQKGIVDAVDISGTPIYLKINAVSDTKLENKLTEEPKEHISDGLFYCLPGKAIISVIDKNNELISEEVQLAQYGQVISMPASVLEQANVVIDICPITGALKSIYKK